MSRNAIACVSPKPHHDRGPRRLHHRGISTLWTIIAMPAALILLVTVVEIGHLWVARVELENALEAAALAAVKEWGDAGGGPTAVAREIGLEYAAANTIYGNPVGITPNHNPGNMPNENASCTGNLIFGAITTNNPPHVFDATQAPNCGFGLLLFDATEEGGLNGHAAWGARFLDTPTPTTDVVSIVSILIDLQGGGGSGHFDFTSGGPQLAASSPEMIAGRDNIVGFTDPASQIVFYPTTKTPSSLVITFRPDPATGDLGFERGDRFRFSAPVLGVSSGTGENDGDGIGRDDVRVTVVFMVNGIPQPPIWGIFIDNKESSDDCAPPPAHPVHPTGIPDLPCPRTNDPENNGQSYVELLGGGGNAFGVRAQATVTVDSLVCRICGLSIGPFSVTAKSTAMYRCGENRPRLVRIRPEHFICVEP